MLCDGQAFVAPAEGLLGTNLLRWDFKYLSEHLPSEQKYGVMLDEGSGKIVMSHSARNGERQVDPAELGKAAPQQQRQSEEDLFNTSDQTRMTFSEFLEETGRFKQSGGKGRLPYFGLHLLWRLKETDNGYLGQIDEEMRRDLFSVKFDLIKEWQDINVLPLVQRFYLFAGLGGTLYHCHYDLQPNLHVQLTGRKRFIIFPPEDWRHLYPFPVHHDLDRRSMVDLDAPDSDRFPEWQGAHGHLVELNPGDALYIPPYWWHHVQSLTPETTSMAMWFFERYPQSAKVEYGVGARAADVSALRDIEEFVGKHFPDAPGEEDSTKSRPVKAAQVAAFMQWVKPRVGVPSAGATPPDETLLAKMVKKPEAVEAGVLELIKEGCAEATTEASARARLRAFLSRRF